MVLAGVRRYSLELVPHWRGEGLWGYAPLCAELGLQDRPDHWHSVTAGIREGLRGWAIGYAGAKMAATNI